MKTKLFFVFWLLIPLTLLLPMCIAAQTSDNPTFSSPWRDYLSYFGYFRPKDPHMFNEEWDNDKADTAQIFRQDGIPRRLLPEDHSVEFRWYYEFIERKYPIPDEGFRLYRAIETPDSAEVVAQLVRIDVYNLNADKDKIKARMKLAFFDGNNIQYVITNSEILSTNKMKYTWGDIWIPQMPHTTALALCFRVGEDTARIGLTVKVYDYKLYKKGKLIFHDNFSRIVTDVPREITLPTETRLSQNYPNPFNPTTTISFSLPKAGDVTLRVYNLLGQEVAELVNGHLVAGNHEVYFNGKNLASGMYVYVLQAGEQTFSRKMLLVK